MMNIIRNFFSSIISFLIVISLTSFIFLASFNKVIFDADLILGTLKSNDTYTKVTTGFLPHMLISGVVRTKEEGQSDVRKKLIEKLDKNSFGAFSVELEEVVENSYNYVSGKNNGFRMVINATDYIPSIRADLEKAVHELKQEGYFQGQDTAELLGSLEESGELTLIVTEKSVEISGTKLSEATAETNDPNTKKPPLQEMRIALGNSKLAEQALLISSIFLAILLFITQIPHYSSGFRWIGGAILSSALLPLITSVVLLFVNPIDLIIKFLKERETFTYAQDSVELLGKNLTVYLDNFLVYLRFYSITLIVIAVLLFATAILVPQIFKHRKGLDSKIANNS